MVLELYVDESSQNKHRYLVLGGIACTAPAAPVIEDAVKAKRLPELPAGEMKWEKVSPSKYLAYERVVDHFFYLNSKRYAYYHCLIADTSDFNHKKHNGGDREVGFNKLVYQLLMNFARKFPTYEKIIVYLDERTTTQSPDDLKRILNFGSKKEGLKHPFPFRRVTFRNSKTSQILQLSDILTGALASRRNGHHLKPDASPAKTALSGRILLKSGIEDLSKTTPWNRRNFCIWNFRYKDSVPWP